MNRAAYRAGGLAGLDIRTKLSLFLLFMVWTVLFTHPACHIALTLTLLAAGSGSGLTAGQICRRLSPLTPLLLMIFLFTGFTVPGGMVHPENSTALATLGPHLTLTRGGLLLGLTFILRLVNMVTLTLLLLSTTSLDHFITLFTKLRMPRTLAVVITTAIRFVPELDRKREQIITAQRARGIAPDRGGRLRKFRARVAVMVPLIVNAILVADQLTMALMNRGFGYRNRWTVIDYLKFKPSDYLILALCLAGLGAGLFIRFQTGWGRI